MTISFDRQSYAPTERISSNASAGLQVRLFHGSFDRVADITGRGYSMYVSSGVELPDSHPDSYGLQFRGYINVPLTGIYSFFLTSDDGSVLRVADRDVVDNDGAHSSQEKSGQVALEKGAHQFELNYMDAGGGGALELKYSVGNKPPQPVPAEWFTH